MERIQKICIRGGFLQPADLAPGQVGQLVIAETHSFYFRVFFYKFSCSGYIR